MRAAKRTAPSALAPFLSALASLTESADSNTATILDIGKVSVASEQSSARSVNSDCSMVSAVVPLLSLLALPLAYCLKMDCSSLNAPYSAKKTSVSYTHLTLPTILLV